MKDRSAILQLTNQESCGKPIVSANLVHAFRQANAKNQFVRINAKYVVTIGNFLTVVPKL